MWRGTWLVVAGLLLALGSGVRGQDLREILYVPLDESGNATIARGAAAGSGGAPKEEGVVGKAGASSLDARGNVDLDRGTMAYWLKLPNGPAEMDWDGYVVVGGWGYWGFVMSPLMVVPEHFCMQFFNVGNYTQRIDWPYLVGKWKAGEWHHVAMVWDRNEGITVYEDGKRIGSNWGSYRWEWNLVPVSLTMSNGLVDELHVYAEALTDEQIGQLARKEKPTGAPIAITPAEKRRANDLARMGWLDEEIGELPVLEAGKAQVQEFARMVNCVDARRSYTELFDGLKASTWPHQIYGHSTHGQMADLYLAEKQTYDRVRLFVQRAYQGELQAFEPGVGYKTLLPVQARAGTYWRKKLDGARSDAHLALTREYGRLGELQWYRADALAQAPASKAALSFRKLEKLPATDMGLGLLAETPARFDQPVRATADGGESWKLASPAFGGFQAVTETYAEPTACDGVQLTLVAEGLTGPTPVQIVVKEPVWTARDWLVADVLLKPSGAGRQVFSLRLHGRPVVSMAKMEFGFTLTAGGPATWLMGKDGSTVELTTVKMEEALPVATADQVEFMRNGHYNVNEGHQFGDPIFNRPFRWLCTFAPDRPEVREMVYRLGMPDGIGTKIASPTVTVPANDKGAPEWAFWQMQAMHECRRMTHWWIDNWQTTNGEFGGIWNDDTDFVENWVGLAMCADESGKIKDSLRRIWEGLWQYSLQEGVSKYVMDDVHSYEEGMGTIANQMIVDYGEPVAIERTMAASSHYDKWLRKLEDGTYRWKSSYFSVNGCWDYGTFKSDSDGSFLMLVPAAHLIWYNRQPEVAKYFRGLKGLAKGARIGTDAYYLLTDPKGFPAYYEQLAVSPNWSRYFQDVNGMVSVSGVTDVIRKQFAPAEYKPLPEFPTYTFDAQFADAHNWLTYQTTGDTRYLVETYKKAAAFVQSEWWQYTAADPSRDRIPLPDNSVVSARMGAMPTQRGAQGSYLPWHGLSYEKGGDEVAALVTVNTDTKLQARLYAATEKALDLTVRVWRLKPGTYQLALAKDANDDGQPEEAIGTREVTLERGSELTLNLPARQTVVLTLTAVKVEEVNFDRADPAISLRDVKLVFNEHLTVPVHNVGTKAAEKVLVRVRDGRSGKVVGEKTIERLEAPAGLKPSHTSVEFLNFNCITDSSIIVEIDPEKKVDDFNRMNNRVELRY